MNTTIYYMYRDASNYKTHLEAMVSGTFSDSQIQDMMNLRYEGGWFIPSDVDLSEERGFSPCEQDDHIWFEIDEDSFEETDDKCPSDAMSADEFYRKWMNIGGKWDENAANDRLEDYMES